MRVFLDANVLFSAAKSDGAVRELLRLLLQAGHECWVDDYVVFEARRNLRTKGAEALTAFETLLTRVRFSPAQVARLGSEGARLATREGPASACCRDAFAL